MRERPVRNAEPTRFPDRASLKQFVSLEAIGRKRGGRGKQCDASTKMRTNFIASKTADMAVHGSGLGEGKLLCGV